MLTNSDFDWIIKQPSFASLFAPGSHQGSTVVKILNAVFVGDSHWT